MPRQQVQRVATRKAMEERKALLGSANPLQRVQQLKTQADLANSATDTTASLQRTRQLMAEVTCPLIPPMFVANVWTVLHASTGTLPAVPDDGNLARHRGCHLIRIALLSMKWLQGVD